jgi:hypothetical protein
MNMHEDTRAHEEPMEPMETDRDLLISRAVDESASDADWEAIKKLAETDPTIWRDVARAQHEHAELASQVESAIAIADEIDAPVEAHMNARFSHRLRVVSTWGGWAVAAAMALAWVAPGLAPGRTPGAGPDQLQAGLGPKLTPQAALDQYIDQGKQEGSVIGEIPGHIIVETIPQGSGVEVIFVRQIMERKHISRFYRQGQDELGRPTAVPVDGPRIRYGPI